MEHRKEYLVCVDSDGCAMDTMDIKHFQCFGPCMIDEWGLEQWKEPLLKRWNQINLYSATRGINRFKALVLLLKEIDGAYCPVPGLEVLEGWTAKTKELSNNALETAIKQADGDISAMKHALSWSEKVNQAVSSLPEKSKKAFPGVLEALGTAHEKADIAVVSSANRQAVEDEWKRCGMLSAVNEICAQDSGSKAHCIETLLKSGYSAGKTVMVGDAPGDLAAAQSAGVFFFPILVKREKTSWERFRKEGLERLFTGSFAEGYQERLIREFQENLQNP